VDFIAIPQDLAGFERSWHNSYSLTVKYSSPCRFYLGVIPERAI